MLLDLMKDSNDQYKELNLQKLKILEQYKKANELKLAIVDKKIELQEQE